MNNTVLNSGFKNINYEKVCDQQYQTEHSEYKNILNSRNNTTEKIFKNTIL